MRPARSPAARLRCQAGATLVELTITLVVFALIVTAIFAVWEQSQRAYFQGSEAAELQQNARVALEQVVREVRQAGYDPCRFLAACPSAFDPDQPGVFPIQAMGADRVWIRADRNGDGDTGDDDESICFYVSGGILRRKTTGGDCTAGGEELARNITGFTLTYHRFNGATTANWAEVKLVRVGVSAQETFMGSPLTVSLRSDVYLRDR
jgi:type IV pilus assembly protein PilW